MIICDLECDNLRMDVTKCHIIAWKEYNEETSKVVREPTRGDIQRILNNTDAIVGHNIIGYDIPVLRKLFDIDYRGKVIDTLVMSHVLYPHLAVPAKANKKMGPHSIEAWALRFGERPKIQVEDWSKWTPDMEQRCIDDINITEKLLKFMCKREGITKGALGL